MKAKGEKKKDWLIRYRIWILIGVGNGVCLSVSGNRLICFQS